METLLLDAQKDGDIAKAAEIIRNGGTVAFPTETVYGLGGNGLSAESAEKIYRAKGRPSDNPLILHLSDPMQAEQYCYTEPMYYTLAAAFMPGPLTVIMKKKDVVPTATTGGLDTVAVRVPSDATARKFISHCALPVAAPSANLSGSPSPTRAEHVIKDLSGRVNAILCGNECEIGLESTIVKLEGEHLTLLRPGAITPEMLKEVFPFVTVDDCTTRKYGENEAPAAPGMKYRHYAPRARVTVLDGDEKAVTDYQKRFLSDKKVGILCPGTLSGARVRDMGSDPRSMAKRLFSALREFDEMEEVTEIYATMPPDTGIGSAVRNRLLKAAGFHVLNLP